MMRHRLPLPRSRAGIALVLGTTVAAMAAIGWGWRNAMPAASSSLVAPVDGEICIVAPPSPYDPALGLPLLAPRPIPADARCPVCGMFPARAPEWAAQVIFQNGDAQFFDSPLSLFQYLQSPERYSPGRNQQSIAARYVTDSSNRQWIDAVSAWYVQGSNALGPMRNGNFPAFQSPEAAAKFAQKRGGRVIAFRDVDAKLLGSMPGANHHAGHASSPPKP